MTHQTYRRLTGLLLGAALGFAFGFPSQAINSLAVPGVQFYQPPFGMVPNILICAVLGGLVGLISSWPNNSLLGILSAAIVGGITLEVVGSLYGTYTPPERIGALIVTWSVLLLPLTGLLGAMFTVLRWMVNKQVEYRLDHLSWVRRLILPALLVLVVGGLSGTVLYPMEGQRRIQEMNALIQAGLQAPDATSLPPALAPLAESFKQRATPLYSLQWVKSDLIDWRIGQPAGYQEWQISIAAARFENGWIVACLFAPGDELPNCKAYDRDPTVAVAPPE